MKQITNEERAKVFALYYGSSRGTCYFNETNYNNERPVDAVFIERVLSGKYECHLILKPLSEITIEDAIEVAKLVVDCGALSDFKTKRGDGFIDVSVMDDFGISVRINFKGFIDKINWMGANRPSDPLPGFDYLRSKSYALPYLGIDLFEQGIAIPQSDVK